MRDAYARLAAALPRLRVRELGAGERGPQGAGWVTAAELAAGGSALDAFLSWLDRQMMQDHGRRVRPDVVATLALHRYAWPTCLLISVPWFLCRRVPRLRLSQVWYQAALGRLAVRTGTFACLPGDPAALLPGARVVPDEEALRAEVRESVAEHLAPLFEAFGPRMRRGNRARWGMATDEITEGLWHVGRLLGAHEEQRAVRELKLLLPGTTAPYTASGAGFRALSCPDGQALATRDRASCCGFYTVRPKEACTTCPRTSDADRVARLSGHPGH
jgi:hypothetical protein